MGIGTYGFLKGSSGTMLDSIEARDQAEIELKKQKQLEQFRADLKQQQEMKEATSFQIEKDPETGKLKTVGYNKQGQRLDSTVRDSTQAEVANKLEGEQDRAYTLEDRGRKTRREDQIFNYANEDQRMQRESHGLGLQATKAQIAAANRSGRDSDKSGKANLSEVMDSVMSRNSKAIQELSEQEGVPLSDIQAGAWRFAEQRVAKGDTPLQLERNFTTYLSELRKAAAKNSTRLERYKKKSTGTDTTGW